ncbi:MAG: DUF4143 domain-containing protein [Ilumatobacteraceae bacterium]
MIGPSHPGSYTRRWVDDELDELIADGAAAIVVEGAKAVGKSTTATARVETVWALDQPAVRELVAADPVRVLGSESVLIDDWQHVPAVWDAVRRAVDNGASPGQILLTGSATPIDHGTHSGAGRIITLRMRPMTLPERGVSEPTVSIRGLLAGSRDPVGGTSNVDLSVYADEILRSGFPAIRAGGDRVRRAQLRGYIDRVIDRDIADMVGTRVRNVAALRRWLTAYAAATATTASYEQIRDAATSGDGDKPARSTTQPYRDALEALFILEPLAAWEPSRNPLSELTRTPKHHLVDPALAASLLRVDAGALLTDDTGPAPIPRDGSLFGALFESLVTQTLRVGAQRAESSCGHLRTQRGEHEVDVIVERADGRVIAFECKLSASVNDADVRHLHWLADRIGSDLLDAVVVTTGPQAYRRPDGIAVVPLALLGA